MDDVESAIENLDKKIVELTEKGMSQARVVWKLRVKRGDLEVEVVGINPETTKELFYELAAKASLPGWVEAAQD